MIDRIVSVFTLALVITGLAIVVKNGNDASKVISSVFSGFSSVQRAAAA